MPTSQGDLHRLCRESILLMRLGLQMQRAQTSAIGVPHHRVAHGGGRLVLDWEYLGRTDQNYSRIHNFLSVWTPYRFGGVLAQPKNAARESNQSRPPLHRWFYKDLVGRDTLFKLCDVQLLPQSGVNSAGGRYLLFPSLSPAKWAALCKRYEADQLDIELVDELARLYGPLSFRDLTSIASCPTLEASVISIEAEFHLLHWEYSQMLELLSVSGALATHEFKQRIHYSMSQANICASEVFEKIRMTARIGDIRDTRILRDGVGDTIRGTLQEQSLDLYEFHTQGGKYVSDLTLFTSEILENVGIPPIVSKETIKRRGDEATLGLRECGVSNESLDRARSLSLQMTPGRAPELAMNLAEIYEVVRDSLGKLDLPTEFARPFWERASFRLD